MCSYVLGHVIGGLPRSRHDDDDDNGGDDDDGDDERSRARVQLQLNPMRDDRSVSSNIGEPLLGGLPRSRNPRRLAPIPFPPRTKGDPVMARTKSDPDHVPKKKARTKEGRTKAEKEAADREFEEEENQEAAFEKAWREEAARRLQRIQEASKEEREEGEVETPPMAPRTPIDSTSAPMALRTLRLHQSTSPKKSIASPKLIRFEHLQIKVIFLPEIKVVCAVHRIMFYRISVRIVNKTYVC